LDKNLAQAHGAYCAISYPELISYAETTFKDLGERQSYITHTASGVFNKAFYLWSKEVGIKKAYHTMLLANTKYWTATTEFIQGACGCLYAAKDLQLNTQVLKSIFAQVGIDTQKCAI
jgi:vibriolysin